MRLGDYSVVGESVDERSESIPTASPNPLAPTNLNSPANTIVAHTILTITLTITKLITLTIAFATI